MRPLGGHTVKNCIVPFSAENSTSAESGEEEDLFVESDTKIHQLAEESWSEEEASEEELEMD